MATPQISYSVLAKCVEDGHEDVADYLIQCGFVQRPLDRDCPTNDIKKAISSGDIGMLDLFIRNNIWSPTAIDLMVSLFTSGNMKLFDAFDRWLPEWRSEFRWSVILDEVIFVSERKFSIEQQERMKEIFRRLIKEIPTANLPPMQADDPMYQVIMCSIPEENKYQTELTKRVVQFLVELGMVVTDAHLSLIAVDGYEYSCNGPHLLAIFNKLGYLTTRGKA